MIEEIQIRVGDLTDNCCLPAEMEEAEIRVDDLTDVVTYTK